MPIRTCVLIRLNVTVMSMQLVPKPGELYSTLISGFGAWCAGKETVKRTSRCLQGNSV